MIASLDFSGIASILSRYVHLLCACLLVGGVFLLSCMFKARGQAGSSDEPVFLRGRRVVKMVVHIGLLFILASGAYNLMLNWVAYGRNIPLTHALLGMHLLLGLLALTLLLITLVGKSPGDREGKTPENIRKSCRRRLTPLQLRRPPIPVALAAFES
jgi:hypothetical protein